MTIWTTSTLGFYIWSQMFSSNRDPSAQIMTPTYYMMRSTFGDMTSTFTANNAGLGAAICVMIMIVAVIVFTAINRIIKDDDITF
jgi:multiple sugar transport system permease protein